MNNLQVFVNKQFGEIRTVMIEGEPYFVGKDVATALGYKDTINALKTHVKDNHKLGWQITTSGQRREMTVIDEAGLYSLIMRSSLPDAEKFQEWVTAEVLPTLRKTGEYRIKPNFSDKFGKAEVDYKKIDYLIKLAEISPSEEQKIALISHAATLLTGKDFAVHMNSVHNNPEHPEHRKNRPDAKLTFEQAEKIRRLYLSGNYTYLDLAKMFNISKTSISNLLSNVTYKLNR